MLQNAYFLAKIGADTAENERNFAEILPKIGNYPTGPLRGQPVDLRHLRRADLRAVAVGPVDPGGEVWGVKSNRTVLPFSDKFDK